MTLRMLLAAAGLALAAGLTLSTGAANAAGPYSPKPGYEPISLLEQVHYGRRCWRDCWGPPWRRHCTVRCVDPRPRWHRRWW